MPCGCPAYGGSWMNWAAWGKPEYREDRLTNVAHAQALAGKLETEKLSVWWDIRLVGGQQYLKVIERELRAAKAVVVIWSKSSVNSEFVLDEADATRKANKLVPTIADGLAIDDLPLGFRSRQVLSIDDVEGLNRAVLLLVLRSLRKEQSELKAKLATMRTHSSE